VFSLDYKMDGPLRTVSGDLQALTAESLFEDVYAKIFTSKCFDSYLHVFNFLWRIKRMEYIICSIWSLQKGDMQKFRTMPCE
jgi:hypothetical protein